MGSDGDVDNIAIMNVIAQLSNAKVTMGNKARIHQSTSLCSEKYDIFLAYGIGVRRDTPSRPSIKSE